MFHSIKPDAAEFLFSLVVLPILVFFVPQPDQQITGHIFKQVLVLVCEGAAPIPDPTAAECGRVFWIDAFAQDADGGLPVASWCETTFNGVIKHDPDSRLASRDEILKAQQEHLGMIQPAQVWFETLVYVGKGW